VPIDGSIDSHLLCRFFALIFGLQSIQRLAQLLFCIFGWRPIERMIGTSCAVFFEFFAADRLFNQSAPFTLLLFVLFCCPPIKQLVGNKTKQKEAA